MREKKTVHLSRVTWTSTCRTWTATGWCASCALLENALGIPESGRFKLVMISVFTDTKNVSESFFSWRMADAFIPKPLLRGRPFAGTQKTVNPAQTR
jgi:hypothetical protein